MSAVRSQTRDTFAETASRAVRKVGWDPRRELEIVKPGNSGEPASVRYGHKPGRVRLIHSPELLEQLAQVRAVLALAGLGAPEDAFDDVVASRVYLQAGSWNICPYSAADYAEILDACADGLRSAETPEPQVYEFTVPAASLFIVSVVGGVYAVEGPGPQGFRRGWQLDQIASSRSDNTALPTYASLCANVQLRLWADNRVLADALRSCFSHPFDALDFETDRGVAILLDTFEFADRPQDGLVWQEDSARELLMEELKYKYDDWPIKAFQFAELLAPHITDRQHQQSTPPSRAGSSGAGERPSRQAERRWDAVRLSRPSNTRPLPDQGRGPAAPLFAVPVDPFADRFAKDAQFRRDVLQAGIGQGKSPLNYSAGPDALDAIYRSRAAHVTVESETTRRQGMAFEIAYMSREELGDGLPTLNSLDLAATRVDTHGDPIFYRKKLPIVDDIPAKLEMGGFPDLLFVVDSSGSMGWDPRAGTGPYDSLLRAIYSVFGFLDQKKKAPYMRFAVVNFSGRTLATQWKGYGELGAIKELLFTHQRGGTVLDCHALENIAAASTDRFLCLMVTDGQIKNAAAAVQVIHRMAARGHGFVLIQVGRENSMTHAVRQLGLPVHVISDHAQLQGLCLQYARQACDLGR